MTSAQTLQFDDVNIGEQIDRMTDADLDRLDFGVIGFDPESAIKRYNATESKLAGLSPTRVVGFPLFDVVAPCMNNFMVAQRFDDAAEGDGQLDVIIDYVLTLRMRPCRVKLRLLAAPDMALRYVLVNRK